jgi:hypothetical protein
VRGIRFLMACVALTAAVTACVANTESYTIDAQYRGGISIEFPRIGDTTLSFFERTDGAVHSTGRALARHPRDKNKVYEITLDLLFRLDGNRVTILRSGSTSNATGDSLRERIEKILPFLHLARKLPPGEKMGPRWYFTKHGAYEVSAEQIGGTREVLLQQGPREVGKFFLDGARLARFRIPTKDNIVLDFNSSAMVSSAKTDD